MKPLAFVPPALLFSVLLVASCERGPATTRSSALPVVSMKIGSRTYGLEVAGDSFTRERGLMERDSMPADRGMIFVFEGEADRGFWMKNTRIPLDILFVDSNGKVVSIHTMKPYDQRTTNSDGPAKYAIELNAGAANENGVKAGDKLVIPSGANSAASAR